MASLLQDLECNGFAILRSQIDSVTLEKLRIDLHNGLSRSQAGIRNLLNRVTSVRELARSETLGRLVNQVLGNSARVVRGVYFDKQKDANWKVAWHQDLTIAVKLRVDVESFGAWSFKGGIQHVQPPVYILEQMIAVRLHLDDADEANGCLRVIPGSHRQGRLSAEEIANLRRTSKIVSCRVSSGDVMLMRPLLLHASSVAMVPKHRRVIHLEYCAAKLPNDLEWYEEI